VQALSNIVYAYDKANCLDRELLQWVFNVAAFRLDHMELVGSPHLSFKPQVCITETELKSPHFFAHHALLFTLCTQLLREEMVMPQ
jgi:hypothetical protein